MIRRSLTHAAFSLLCYTVPSETVPVVCLPRAVRQCKQHAFEPQRKRRCTRGAFARYPRHEAQRAVPLWLRLDFNMLDSARLLPLCCAEADPTKPDVRRPREIKASPHCRSCAQPGSPCRTTCPLCRMLAKPSRTRAPAATLCMRLPLVCLTSCCWQVPDDDDIRKWRHNLRVRVSLRDG